MAWLLLAVAVVAWAGVWVSLHRSPAPVARRRTPYRRAGRLQRPRARHWVRMVGVDGEMHRPVCTTCPWAGAAVVDRAVAVAAGRAHGDVA